VRNIFFIGIHFLMISATKLHATTIQSIFDGLKEDKKVTLVVHGEEIREFEDLLSSNCQLQFPGSKYWSAFKISINYCKQNKSEGFYNDKVIIIMDKDEFYESQTELEDINYQQNVFGVSAAEEIISPPDICEEIEEIIEDKPEVLLLIPKQIPTKMKEENKPKKDKRPAPRRKNAEDYSKPEAMMDMFR